MKEQKTNRSQWLHIRLSAEEKNALAQKAKATTCRTLSDYARQVLLKKPVVTRVRDETKEELLHQVTLLRKELKAIGNNFNQLIKKMQLLSRADQMQAWYTTYQLERKQFMTQLENIESELKKLALKWWQ